MIITNFVYLCFILMLSTYIYIIKILEFGHTYTYIYIYTHTPIHTQLAFRVCKKK